MWNEEFKLPGGSNPQTDIWENFEPVIRKHKTFTDNPPIRICLNKIEKGITFEIHTGYYPKLLMSKTTKLLGSIKSKINKDKNCKNVPHLKIAEVALVHWNILPMIINMIQ